MVARVLSPQFNPTDFLKSNLTIVYPFSSDGTLHSPPCLNLQLGTTAIGIETSEGVILAVEKRVSSPLMEPSSIEKVLEIDEHIGCAMSGMTADARTMIDHARVVAQVMIFF